MDVPRHPGRSPWSDPVPTTPTTVRLSSEAATALTAMENIFREDRDVVLSRAIVFTFKRNVSMARYLSAAPKAFAIPFLSLLAAFVGTGIAIGYKLHDRMFSPITAALFGGLFVGLGFTFLISGRTSRFWLRKDEQVTIR